MLTLFGGKGGVGKTTCAAAWGLARAAARRRVLILSTDPAHSLADVFATKIPKNRVTALRPRLSILELDAAAAVNRWLTGHRPALATLLERGTLLDREDVRQALSLPIPGLDELAAFITMSDLDRRGEYDEVVVDTAPTGHALRLLETSRVVGGFTNLLESMHERHAMVAHALGGQVGASELVEELRRDAAEGDARLHDPARTHMVWVTVPEPVAVAETLRTIEWLIDRHFPLTSLVVNRFTFESASGDSRTCRECRARAGFERATMAPVANALRRTRPRIAVRVLPDYDREPRGLRALGRLARQMTESPRQAGGAGVARGRVVRLQPAQGHDAHDAPPALALASGRLVFFGGKGGVGKTTCAAAASLAIAEAFPSRRVRLLSTDPASSLGDALSMDIGDQWTPVFGAGRLEVRELDAAAAFDKYRLRYEAAVEAFFDSLRGGSSFDAVADRAVFSRLFELAPPGVDELVALITVIELVEEDPKSLLIVDTAPTGHALRLLSAKGDLRGWLDLLMRLLVKYQISARAESFTRQLVDLSRGLRKLNDLLSDSRRTKFVVVVRPGALPRLETIRLMAQLRRLRVSVPALILNAETAGTCRGCRARIRAEAAEVQELSLACRGRSRRCDIIHAPLQLPPPRGVRELGQWSTAWRPHRVAMADGTYLYCLVKSDRRPRLARAPRGVPGAGALRLLDGPAGTWLVAADVPLDRYGANQINSRLKDLEWVSERALAHEAVVEFFARAHDVIPLKLFTIFADDQRARVQVGTAQALSGVFRRIAGCSEWSVRLSCSPAVVAEVSRSGAHTRRRESGTSFLRRKKTQRDEVHKAALAARAAVEQVFRRLDGVARDAVRKQSDLPGSHLMLDAAFLVPRTKVRAFEREVARLSASASKGGCELVMSGPWPPYHFVAAKGDA